MRTHRAELRPLVLDQGSSVAHDPTPMLLTLGETPPIQVSYGSMLAVADAAPFTGFLSAENHELVLRDIEQTLGLDAGSLPDLEVGLERGAKYFAALLQRPAPSAGMLASALGQRLREVLSSTIEITVHEGVLGMRARKGSMSGIVGVALRLPIPPDGRLELELRMFARDLAEFIRDVTGKPWPAPGAEPRVTIDPDEARIWWDAPGYAEPVLKLRPLNRAEIDA